MKLMKMFGLVALAAVALMAFVGATSASATVLCKTALKENCAAAKWDYNLGTMIKANVEAETEVTFKELGGAVFNSCTAAEYEPETANTGGEGLTITGAVANWTFPTCNLTTKVPEHGKFDVVWQSGTFNGTLTGKEYRITMVFAGNTCGYIRAGTENLGTLTGGMMATIDVHTKMERKEGPAIFCPKELVMDGAYTVTAPEPLYVSKN